MGARRRPKVAIPKPRQARRHYNLTAMECVVWLSLGAAPLAVTPGLFVGFDVTPKLLILFVAACLSLAAIVEWYPGLAVLTRGRVGMVYVSGVALQAISLILSTVFSQKQALSLAGASWRRYGLVTQLAILLIGLACACYFACHPGDVRRNLTPLLIAGCAAALFGIAQFSGYDPLFDPRLYTSAYHSVVKPPATLGHSMYFSAYLLPVIFVASALLFETQSAGFRGALMAAIGIVLFGSFISGSRSALLGLLAGVLVWVACGRRLGINSHAAWRPAAALGAAVLLFSGFAWSGAGQKFRADLARWKDDALGGPRLRVWRESMVLMGRHPVLGAGPETFAQDFRELESLPLAAAYPDYFHESPHNLLVEIASAQGGLGLIALLLVCGSALAAGWKMAAKRSFLAVGLLTSLAAMLVALQFMPLVVSNALCLYCLAGMLVAVESGEARQVARAPRFIRAVAGVGILGFGLAALAFTVQDWEFAQAGNAVRRGDFTGAAAAYRAIERWPFSGQDLWLSRQFAAASISNPAGSALTLRLAAGASRRAEQYSEDPFNAYYQSAALAIAAGDSREGEDKLRTAIQLAPTWYRPRLLLAQSLLIRGQAAEGAEQGRKAIALAGWRRDEVERAINNLATLASGPKSSTDH